MWQFLCPLMEVTVAACATDKISMKPSEKSENEEYMMGDAYRVAKQAYDKQDKTMATRDAGLTKEQVEAAEVHAKQAYDKQDKTMATRDAGLTKEQVEAAEVHAAGSSHCKPRLKSALGLEF
jgi:hypothetical protein